MTETAPEPIADTSVKAQTFPAPSKLDAFKGLVGDLARPFSIYTVAGATAKAIWGGAPADVIGAAGLILVGLYGAKVYENRVQAQADASVKIAQAGPSS
jgi:hypothetical protein